MRGFVSGILARQRGLIGAFLCVVMALTSGCVGFGKSASPEVVGSIRRIVIVPMEPPPLGGGGGFFEDLPEGGPQDVPLFLVVAGVVLLWPYAVDSAPPPIDLSEKVAQWYATGRAWAPTVVLAHEAEARLSAAGAWDVKVREKLCAPPSLGNRERTWHMENWFRPLRKWYKQSTSALSREELDRQDADAVLEVGVLNYTFIRGNYFSFQVMSRLVTVKDGVVRARARSFVGMEVENPRRLFDDEAKGFKQLVADEGGKLLEKNLRKMGLARR